MRKDTTSGLLMVAMLTVLGTGRGDSSRPMRQSATPSEVTQERIENIGRALVNRVIDLAEKVPDGDYPPETLRAILEQWQSTPECSVAVGLVPAGAAEIARFISEETAGTLEPVIAGFMIDGWGRPIEVNLEPMVFPLRPRIVLRSSGANGDFESLVYEAGEFAAEDEQDDIVWSFDQFCRWPAEPASEDLSDVSPSSDADRQARTIVDVRNLGVASLSWLTDQLTDETDYATGTGESADAGLPCPSPDPSSGGEANGDGGSGRRARGFWMPSLGMRLDESEVAAILHPSNTFFYMQSVPARDGWGEPLEVYLEQENFLAEPLIVIRSPGRDGSFDGDCYTVGPFDAEDADQDIVWADGYFMRWPDGAKSLASGDTAPGGADTVDPEGSDSSTPAPAESDAEDPGRPPS